MEKVKGLAVASHERGEVENYKNFKKITDGRKKKLDLSKKLKLIEMQLEGNLLLTLFVIGRNTDRKIKKIVQRLDSRGKQLYFLKYSKV